MVCSPLVPCLPRPCRNQDPTLPRPHLPGPPAHPPLPGGCRSPWARGEQRTQKGPARNNQRPAPFSRTCASSATCEPRTGRSLKRMPGEGVLPLSARKLDVRPQGCRSACIREMVSALEAWLRASPAGHTSEG